MPDTDCRPRRAALRLAWQVACGWGARRWAVLIGTALIVNAAWELAQRPLYVGHTEIARCLQAAVVDAGYITASAALALWVARGRRGAGFWLALTGSLAAAAAGVEAWAMSTDRWAYADAMPTIAGLGLSPLVQLPLLGALSAAVAWRLRPRTPELAAAPNRLRVGGRVVGTDEDAEVRGGDR